MEEGGWGVPPEQPSSRAAEQPSSRAAEQPSSRAAEQAAEQPEQHNGQRAQSAAAVRWQRGGSGAAMHRQLGEELAVQNSTAEAELATAYGGHARGAELTSRWSAPWCNRPGRRRRRGEPPRSPADRGREEAQVSCEATSDDAAIFLQPSYCVHKREGL